MSLNELPELPCDPNISILPFELAVCAVMIAVGLLALLLTSCAGTTYEPCVSYTDAEGKEIKACVRIERSADTPVRNEDPERTGVSALPSEGKPDK